MTPGAGASAALVVFVGVYLVMAAGRLPGLRVDRTGAAIIGASLMIALGVLSAQQAYRAIDYRTLVLLFGMMIVVANLRLSGVLSLVSMRVIRHARYPAVLLAALIAVAGTLSAFFVNDVVCLALSPVVLELAAGARRNPVPYLLALAMGSNVGSAATITGNPQNMVIANLSGIGYRQFVSGLAPVAAIGMLLTAVLIACLYPSEFFSRQRLQLELERVRVIPALMWKSVLVAAALIAAFFAGAPAPEAALLGGAVLLLTRRVNPERIYREIDWSLLALFAGLFVVIAGVEKILGAQMLALAAGLHLHRVAALSGVAAVLSNLVSNVPAVLLLGPLVAHLAHARQSWLTLAMASTLAGNLTVPGSVANLIVIQRARHVVHIGFWEYLRVGAPLTVLSLLAGVLWLR